MLFLAVFCGFLAENFREHQVEHGREKQYMQSFIYDLQNDTVNLNAGFPLKDQRIIAIDSFFHFFENHPDVDVIPGNVFRYMRRSLWDRHFRRNTTTIDQLKNAGGFRLIRKKNIADSIAAYDLLWQRAEFWREGYISLQQKGKELLHKIIDATPLLSNYRQQPTFFNQRKIVDSLSVKINRENLNEFFNFSADQKTWTSQDEQAYEEIEKTAERLITLIRKEYGLK